MNRTTDDVTSWTTKTWRSPSFPEQRYAILEEADNIEDLYRVTTYNYGENSINVVTQVFFGETAWSDIARFVRDETGSLWFDFNDFYSADDSMPQEKYYESLRKSLGY